uniref:TonB-dependent receptor n=3 Tax=unclassified Sphingomonas TaxID=196159 RepID=UPI00226A3BE2
MRYVAAMMVAASWPAMAQAQQAAAPVPAAAPATKAAAAAQAQDQGDEPDIIVRGSRNLPGSVVGDIPPEEQLGPADIRSYGVSSVSDLLTELAPQTTSGVGGPPVVLLNGKRISGFQEIRDIPTEAIARVDILPEEVALKYGYRADQRVVNIVLRRRFHSTTVELADRAATDGGRNIPQADVDLLTIQQGKRFNLHTKYTQSSTLTESERNIAAGSDDSTGDTSGFDQRPYRTLLPFSQTLNTNAVFARPIGNVSATVNAEIESSNSVGLFGLPRVALTVPTDNPFAADVGATSLTRVLDGGDFAPLAQRNSALSAHLGTTLNGSIGTGWQWTVTGTYDRVHSETFTETGVDATAFQARLNANDPTADPLGPVTASDFAASPATRAYSTSSTGSATALVNGSLFSLPAGPVSTALRIEADTSDFDSSSYRAGVVGAGQVSRDSIGGRVNLDVPLTSRSKNVLPWLGNLSVNVNAEAQQLSDFGTLTTIGYGINWAPITAIRLIGSISDADEAPTAAQLGNPNISTPNVRVFDYVTGTTATVTTLAGGNADLVADNRHVAKLGLTLKPWSGKDINFTANYTNTHTDNPIASFPAATAAIEAAFPDRFTRDADGTLIRLDTRPINFARSESSSLRWGINFSAPIKSKIQKELEAFRNGTGPNPFAG